MSSAPPPAYQPAPAKAPPAYTDQAPLLSDQNPRPAPDYNVQSTTPPPSPPSRWKDVPFAIVFILFFVGFLAFSVATWNRNFLNEHHNDTKGKQHSDDSGLDSDLLRKMGKIAAYCTCIGLAFAALWLQICKQFPKQMIYIVIVFNVLVCFALAVMFFAAGIIIGGVIWLFFGALSVLFYYFWRRRIPFAAQMLTTTTGVVQDFPAMVGFSFLALFGLIAWIVIWSFGASSASNIGNPALYVLTVFVFYWVAQVVKNVVHTTSAGTFASWYFHLGTPQFPTNPTLGAFKRASTYSFGSIAFGSLIIALIQTVKFVLNSARRAHRNEFFIACVDCLLGCIENLVRYFNTYAFTQVAVYGKDYITAAKDTWSLFLSHGFDIIVNDDLIGPVLGFASFISGLMLAIVAFAWGAYELGTSDHALPYLIVLVIIVFFIGLVEAAVVFEPVNSGVAAIMVCFCTAPNVLRDRQPLLYTRFTELYGRRVGFLASS